jgi:hypothetical protein
VRLQEARSDDIVRGTETPMHKPNRKRPNKHTTQRKEVDKVDVGVREAVELTTKRGGRQCIMGKHPKYQAATHTTAHLDHREAAREVEGVAEGSHRGFHSAWLLVDVSSADN